MLFAEKRNVIVLNNKEIYHELGQLADLMESVGEGTKEWKKYQKEYKKLKNKLKKR